MFVGALAYNPVGAPGVFNRRVAHGACVVGGGRAGRGGHYVALAAPLAHAVVDGAAVGPELPVREVA